MDQRYFINQLPAGQRSNFVAVYEALVGGANDFITLPVAMTDAAAESELMSELLYYNCPELFMLSTNEMTRWLSSDGRIKFNVTMTAAEYESYCIRLFDLLSELNEETRDMSDWKKSKYVYDLIIEKTSYESAGSDAVNAHEGSCLGPLSVGKARCQGYVNAYQLCMWAVGLECYAVTGVAGSDNGPHAWNITIFDGNWYLSDVTWDDRDGDMTVYNYFNVSEDQFFEHTLDAFWTELNMPACEKMDMSYFVVNDYYVAADKDLKTEFTRILEAHYHDSHTVFIKFATQAQYDAIMADATYNEYISEWLTSHNVGASWRTTYWAGYRVMYIDFTY